MVDLFPCHTGRTAARMPRSVAHVAAIILTRVTGRVWDYDAPPRGRGRGINKEVIR